LKGYRWLKLGLRVPREQLYQRINQRAEKMFQAGFLEEVRLLIDRFPGESHAFKAIGYRQAAEYLEGRLTLAEAIDETKKQSRHYAKRQLTWFRADSEIVWLDGQLNSSELRIQAADLVNEFLNK
jgi:tRNA dimethylallyltransferase